MGLVKLIGQNFDVLAIYMKITKKFEVVVTIDTEKANTNENKFGANYDTEAYPNWQINHLGREGEFIEACVESMIYNFKFTGMKCKIKVLE